MKVTIPKNAKHLVIALKTIVTLNKKINLHFNAKRGIWLEALSDKRCGYIKLAIPSDDLIFSDTNEQEHIEFGLDLKGFIHGLKDITTLTDVIIMDIENATLKLVVKTKQTETTTLFKHEHILNQKLDTNPSNMETVCVIDMNSKDLDDALKKCAVKKLVVRCENNAITFHPYGLPDICLLTINHSIGNRPSYEQYYLMDDFADMVKSTLAKKVTLSISFKYPIKLTYKLIKNSVLDMYLCECHI